MQSSSLSSHHTARNEAKSYQDAKSGWSMAGSLICWRCYNPRSYPIDDSASATNFLHQQVFDDDTLDT
jgi:hypothetical protein